MNEKRFTISILTGVVLVLFFIGGIGTNITIFNSGYAQTEKLGKPIIVEKGADRIQKEIGSNGTKYTFTAHGILNGNIEYNKKGEYFSTWKGNNMTFDRGKGVLTTKDGRESANWTFIEVGNGTAIKGASIYSTNSTGKLSFLNNLVVIFKGGYEENGDYALKYWPWK